MTAFLLVLSASSYLFSGCACYIATTRKMPLNFKKVALIWIAFSWPTWLINEIAKEEEESTDNGQQDNGNRGDAFACNVSDEITLGNNRFAS